MQVSSLKLIISSFLILQNSQWKSIRAPNKSANWLIQLIRATVRLFACKSAKFTYLASITDNSNGYQFLLRPSIDANTVSLTSFAAWMPLNSGRDVFLVFSDVFITFWMNKLNLVKLGETEWKMDLGRSPTKKLQSDRLLVFALFWTTVLPLPMWHVLNRSYPKRLRHRMCL